MRKAILLVACGMLYVTSHSQKITDETKSLFQQKIGGVLHLRKMAVGEEHQQRREKQVKVNVNGLRTGIYFLEIVDTIHRECHQLSVLR